MVPAPGQGALAVQCRDADEEILNLLVAIDDPPSRATTTAERTFLSALGGGCAAPVGAHAVTLDEVVVRLEGLVLSPDGARAVRVAGDGEPSEVGERLAREALAAGAERILEEVHG
jgi:hydroxymethylbilane synthase